MLQLVLIQFAAWFRLPSFKLPTFHQVFAEEAAQDAFEYLLVVGVVVVAIVTAAMTLPIGAIITSTTGAITGAFGLKAG